jgi:2-C-methyl-D-erythritol 4-phosphate cytidylyltransferase
MPIAVIFPVVTPAYLGAGAKNTSRAYAKIDGREVFLRCVELFAQRDQVTQRIVVVPPDDMELMAERYSAHLGFQGVTVSGGGSDWFGCVARALEKLDAAIDTVIIHDGCCPAVPFTLLDSLEEALARNKSAAGVVPVLPTRAAYADVTPTASGGGVVAEYVDMAKVMEVQSPQIFSRKPLTDAYAARGSSTYVDDAELVQVTGGKIATVPGSRYNLRIDSDELVRLGKDLLEHMPKPKSKTPLTPFGEAEW